MKTLTLTLIIVAFALATACGGVKTAYDPGADLTIATINADAGDYAAIVCADKRELETTGWLRTDATVDVQIGGKRIVRHETRGEAVCKGATETAREGATNADIRLDAKRLESQLRNASWTR